MSDRPPASPNQPQPDNGAFEQWKAGQEALKRFRQQTEAYQREQEAEREAAQLSPGDLAARLTPLIRRIVREVLQEERDRPRPASPQANRCSFCGKAQERVGQLIGGVDRAYICNECVALCNELIAARQTPLSAEWPATPFAARHTGDGPDKPAPQVLRRHVEKSLCGPRISRR